jgi:hypothetical protein
MSPLRKCKDNLATLLTTKLTTELKKMKQSTFKGNHDKGNAPMA